MVNCLRSQRCEFYPFGGECPAGGVEHRLTRIGVSVLMYGTPFSPPNGRVRANPYARQPGYQPAPRQINSAERW